MGWDVSFSNLRLGSFVARPNRFAIVARVRGRLLRVACRDPGRLRELLLPGAPLLLAPATTTGRRTRFTAVLVRRGRRWISLVPALANRLFAVALKRRGVPGLVGARIARSEVRHGLGRLDFAVRHRGRELLTEVKSATFVEAGRALFPDAPTVRGARHLRELAAHARAGGQALLVFVVQRSDAGSLSPHAGHDPAFTAALVDAACAGVRVRAYACRTSVRGIRLDREIPVLVSGPSRVSRLTGAPPARA